MNRRQPQSAFSLLELIVVLVIIGLIAAMVTVKWSTPLRHAQFNETIRKIQSIDHQSREHSKSRRLATQIKIDLNDHTIEYQRVSNAGILSEQKYQLHSDTTIEEVVTPMDRVDSGQFSYIINAHAMSDSLAIHLSNGVQNKWVSIIGGTGQTYVYDNENEIGYPSESPGTDSR